jgi:serine/threonine protein kinase
MIAAGKQQSDDLDVTTFADFVTRLLQIDPSRRMSLAEAATHGFLDTDTSAH